MNISPSSQQTFNGEVINHHQGDAAAKTWFLFSALWFPFFAIFGFMMAIKFFFPDFLSDELMLTFGRIRPVHVNGVLFGFITSGLLGAMFWIIPRLCARPLYKPRLTQLSAFLWNGAVVIGLIWILLGGSQGREYAELPWAIDVAVMAALLIMAYIVLGTIIKRREKKLYVSLWYFAGTVVWFPIVYFIGNVMWRAPEGALNGINDAIFNWYYGHNVLGLWFTTLGIPIWYYFIPRIIKRPLYSHLLSLIAFFTIAFFYTGVGAHHLLQAPIPEWLKTVAVIMSILMIVPVITFATNIMLTMRGSWKSLGGNPAFQFIMAAFFMYVLASIQGSFQALRDTNAYTHFSQWPVGHAHLALLGGFGFLAVGMSYYLVPRIMNIKIYSQKLARLSFWIASIGFIVFFLAMTIAGLVANADWWNHINVVETLPTLEPYFVLRAIGGGSIIIGALIFVYNIFMTFSRRTTHEEEKVEELGAVKSTLPHSPLMRRSQERINLPIILGGGLVVFVITTFMVIAMPYMFTENQPSERAQPLTSLEQQGADLYKSLGCFYCHNQFIRPQDWAMGDAISATGDFYYSVPNFMGTERTGPPLGQIGGKRPWQWEIDHLIDPQSVSPSSIMPDFAFLDNQDLDALTAYMESLGGQNLETNDFQPWVPAEFADKSNPNMPLMMSVRSSYDIENQEYSGDMLKAEEWTQLFEDGKKLFTQKCLSCHGCSGNGQGPYARQTVAHPANLNIRITGFPGDYYHFWRVNSGVPGTAMPAWGQSLNEETIWTINTYEMSFALGAFRTVSGEISDQEGDDFNDDTHVAPAIAGTEVDFNKGEQLFELFCVQCHGSGGQADGPASINSPGGYINPEPANFTESGQDFPNYGRWVWKVKEGVETTNMPPWKYVLNDEEIFQVIFYAQGFSEPADYNAKWAPLYTDPFGKDRMENE